MQVAVRVRPSRTLPSAEDPRFVERLIASFPENYSLSENQMCVNMPDSGGVVLSEISKPDHLYPIPLCFWSHDKQRICSDQRACYRKTGKVLVENMLQGCNACLVMCGASGSGKTYSLRGLSVHEILVDRVAPPVVERSVGSLELMLELLQREMETLASAQQNCSISVSYLLAQRDSLTDLLAAATQQMSIAVRHDSSGRVVFTNRSVTDTDSPQRICAYRVPISDVASSIRECVHVGDVNRVRMAVECGGNASQSSTLLVVNLLRSLEDGFVSAGQLLIADTSVDECATLQALCADAVAGKRGTVASRTSALGLCLRNAFGGNCHTCLFGCIAPSSYDRRATKRTLRLCELATKVINKPVAQFDLKTALKRDNELMKQQRDTLARQLSSVAAMQHGSGDSTAVKDLQRAMGDLEQLVVQSARALLAIKQLADADYANYAIEYAVMATEQVAAVTKQLSDNNVAIMGDTSTALVLLLADQTLASVMRFVIEPDQLHLVGSSDICHFRLLLFEMQPQHFVLESITMAETSERMLFLTPADGARVFLNGQLLQRLRTPVSRYDVIGLETGPLFYVDVDDPDSKTTRRLLSWYQSQFADIMPQSELKLDGSMPRADLLLAMTELRIQYQLHEQSRLAKIATELCQSLMIRPTIAFEADTMISPTADSTEEKLVEVMIAFTLRDASHRVYMSTAQLQATIAYLHQCRRNEPAGKLPLKLELPAQLAGYAFVSTRNLYYLSAVGLDEETNRVLSTSLVSSHSSRGFCDIVITIAAPVSHDHETLFLSDDPDVVSAQWSALRDSGAQVQLIVRVDQCAELYTLPLPVQTVTVSYQLLNQLGTAQFFPDEDTETSSILTFSHRCSYAFTVTQAFIDWLRTGVILVTVHVQTAKLELTPFQRRSSVAAPLQRTASSNALKKSPPKPKPVRTASITQPRTPRSLSVQQQQDVAVLKRELSEAKQSAQDAEQLRAAVAKLQIALDTTGQELEQAKLTGRQQVSTLQVELTTLQRATDTVREEAEAAKKENERLLKQMQQLKQQQQQQSSSSCVLL